MCKRESRGGGAGPRRDPLKLLAQGHHPAQSQQAERGCGGSGTSEPGCRLQTISGDPEGLGVITETPSELWLSGEATAYFEGKGGRR